MSSNQESELNALYNEQARDSRFMSLIAADINFVPGAGPMNPDIMLVGEAPGAQENARRTPFIGRAGINLTHLLNDLNIDPFGVFLTNACKLWPQGKDLSQTELEACSEYLKREIEIVNPKIVGLCGRSAIRSIYPELSEVFKNNGDLLDGKFVPLYHPAVVTYSQDKKKLVRAGYAALRTHLKGIKTN